MGVFKWKLMRFGQPPKNVKESKVTKNRSKKSRMDSKPEKLLTSVSLFSSGMFTQNINRFLALSIGRILLLAFLAIDAVNPTIRSKQHSPRENEKDQDENVCYQKRLDRIRYVAMLERFEAARNECLLAIERDIIQIQSENLSRQINNNKRKELLEVEKYIHWAFDLWTAKLVNWEKKIDAKQNWWLMACKIWIKIKRVLKFKVLLFADRIKSSVNAIHKTLLV